MLIRIAVEHIYQDTVIRSFGDFILLPELLFVRLIYLCLVDVRDMNIGKLLSS